MSLKVYVGDIYNQSIEKLMVSEDTVVPSMNGIELPYEPGFDYWMYLDSTVNGVHFGRCTIVPKYNYWYGRWWYTVEGDYVVWEWDGSDWIEAARGNGTYFLLDSYVAGGFMRSDYYYYSGTSTAGYRSRPFATIDTRHWQRVRL